jgi:hypothetical protein
MELLTAALRECSRDEDGWLRIFNIQFWDEKKTVIGDLCKCMRTKNGEKKY